MRVSAFTLAAAAFGLARAAPSTKVSKRSPQPDLVDGKYILNRQTSFSNHVVYTFESGGIPDGLSASDYPVGQTSYTTGNVFVQDGFLQLLVQGGQTEPPYTSGQISTDVSNILHGSVRTTAILSAPPGVCNGKSNSQTRAVTRRAVVI